MSSERGLPPHASRLGLPLFRRRCQDSPWEGPVLREVPAWLLQALQGPWSLRKWMAGLGGVPFLGLLREGSQEEVGPAARGKGTAPPRLSPGSSLAPRLALSPPSDALGLSACALPGTVLDFLPPARAQRAGGFSLPTDV